MSRLPAALAAALIASAGPVLAQPSPSVSTTTTYHTAEVDGLHVFYREAGPKDAPTLLLLHGFPSSSAMFATLIPLLADRYHVVAPDYPGFGLSDAPPPSRYAYTFDHLDRRRTAQRRPQRHRVGRRPQQRHPVQLFPRRHPADQR